MRRRTFLLGTVGGAGVIALAGCNGGTEDDPSTDAEGEASSTAAARPTLRLAGEDVGFPSPFAYMRGGGYVKASLIYDTLVWKDSTGAFLPWLAESFETSDDELLHTFELRPDATWHDGRPVSADDVVFTFEYFRSQTISPQVIVQPLPELDEVVATGEHTVEFRLDAPLAPFLGFGGVGSVPIVPRHIWSTIEDAAMESDPAVLVGSGPYRLASYTPGEGAYLYEAYDEHYLGMPFVRRLEYVAVGDALTGLQAGELDAITVPGVVPTVLEPFRSNPELVVLDAPSGNSGSGLFWNLARGGALADVRFRHACAMAIDRDDLVQRLHGGNAEAGNPGWIPRANRFHADVEQYPFDPAGAEAMLDTAGYERAEGGGVRQDPDGQPLRFSLLVTGSAPVVDLVVGALGAVGIELTPQALDTPSFNQQVIAGESEMSIISFGGMNTDHAPGYLRQVYSSNTRTTQHAQGYVNADVDRLCEQQQREIDESQQMETVAEIQRLIAADLPILPLVYPDSFAIYDEAAFDAWYFTEGGVGSTVPAIDNKHVFLTGRQTGLDIRPVAEGPGRS